MYLILDVYCRVADMRTPGITTRLLSNSPARLHPRGSLASTNSSAVRRSALQYCCCRCVYYCNCSLLCSEHDNTTQIVINRLPFVCIDVYLRVVTVSSMVLSDTWIL